MADDMGYECIGANGGSSYETPNIDQMATEGMRFEHCYSNPACTPSRVQIMTGRYNVYNYTRFAQLKRGETTFANLLK
ncbi:MAG: sulfatase-like hydrolase/transferase, partial [Verrucomicrobiota bacterium]|nr:sulfatase-like hydrolase/transferase [Verrucomicrobiota bacterium]